MSEFPLIALIPFSLFILGLLALDLGVFHRKSHEISHKEAVGWCIVWVTLALLFNVFIYFWHGSEPAILFFTGYLIEQSLSVDNLFVFALIFGYFKVPKIYQHRVLFWGIIGALVLRAFFILTGSALLNSFEWIFYVFGAFLVFTGVRMAFHDNENIDPEHNPLLRLVRRFMPVTAGYREDKFVVREHGKLFVTPLFLVLVLVESTDVVFAVDSIPAIFAITTDPFIVYTSNVFAILGLRSFYFLLSGVLDSFHYLKYGLAAVLSFVGLKMLLADVYHLNPLVSLAVIAFLLGTAIVASIWKRRHEHQLQEMGVLPADSEEPAE
jgi:tellurite resistance protein TerC